MIVGRDYDLQSIGALEEQEWRKFRTHETPYDEDIEAYIYYKRIFRYLLLEHGDKRFDTHIKKTNPKDSRTFEADDHASEILGIEDSKFVDAMYYAQLKGFQNAFNVILNPVTIQLDEDFFKNPYSLADFLFWMDAKTPEETLNDTLDQDEVHLLITYTRRNFENMRDIIMGYAEIFYKKGMALAFEQIRQDVVGVDYDIPFISRITSVPLSSPFRVTPAFLAKFKFEDSHVEQWDLVWDESYGREYYANLVATLTINQFTVKQVKEYRDSGIRSYIMVSDYLNLDSNILPDTDTVYVGEMKWPKTPEGSQPRSIYEFEYEMIRDNIEKTLSRLLGIDSQHLVVFF